MKIKSIQKIKLKEPIPMYDVVCATPYNNFLIHTKDNRYIVSHNCGLMDEVNFSPGANVNFAQSKIMKTYDAVKKRMYSRFTKNGVLSARLFIVSSKKSEMDFIESYVKTVKDSPNVLIVDEPQWNVKPEGTFSNKRFQVAVGNKKLISKIVNKGDSIDALKKQGYDIIDVPLELKREFERDINRALMDLAGVSASISSSFIAYENLEGAFCKRKNPFNVNIISTGTTDNLEIMDFFDPDVVPEELYTKQVYVHIDASLTGDRTGISAVAAVGLRDNMGYVDGEVIPVQEIIYAHLFSVGIQCPAGAELSLEKNRKFVYYLKYNLGWNIAGVSMDGFQCLPADTYIFTSNGDKKIIDLDEDNDMIYSYNIKEGNIELSNFKNLQSVSDSDIFVRITLNNGKELECTESHPILMYDSNYCRADELKIGDLILNSDLYFSKITNVERIKYDKKKPVYDIEVPKNYNFLLSSGFIVHNSRDTLQQLTQAGFKSSLVSLDKTSDGYMYLRASINEKRIFILDIQELTDELINLEQNNQTGKVDHPIEGCFSGGTKIILVKDKTEEIAVSFDELYHDCTLSNSEYSVEAFDFETNDIVMADFVHPRLTRYTKSTVLVVFEDSSMIECTPNHRFLTEGIFNKEYTEAQNLLIGTQIVGGDIVKEIIPIEHDKEIPVYDIEVPLYHNFRLENGCIVHNSKDIADSLCLSYDTKLNLVSGEKITIEELFKSGRKDCYIYSYNIERNCICQSHIANVIRKDSIPAFLYHFDLSNGKHIEVTSDHKILSLSSKMFKEAHDIVLYEKIFSSGFIENGVHSYLTVTDIKIIDNSDYVYDLQLENIHNFAVDAGIFVHNCGALYNASLSVDKNSLYILDDYDTTFSVSTGKSENSETQNLEFGLKNEASNPEKSKQEIIDEVLQSVTSEQDSAVNKAEKKRYEKFKNAISQSDRFFVSENDIDDAFFNGSSESNGMLIW